VPPGSSSDGEAGTRPGQDEELALNAEMESGLLRPERPRRFRRGASILPTLFTTGNLFLGFWSMVRTLDGDFREAALLIGGAAILDMLDGRIARLTHTASEFGAQLDSLADAVSFGVAPALLAYVWALSLVPRAGWPAAFLFTVCGVMRLARFNVQRHVVDARFFVGLPIPAGAAQVAAVVFVIQDRLEERWQAVLVLALVVVLAFLMVSTFRYRSFKGVDLRRRRSYMIVLGIALLFLLIAAHPEVTLVTVTSLYTASGPLAWLAGALRRRREPPATSPAPEVQPAQ
jgi:CDP-diacylglycerol--serine O-phosphatidyltransferase